MKKSKKLSNKHHLLVEMPYAVLHVLLKYKTLRAWCNNIISSRPSFWDYIDFKAMGQQPEKWISYAFRWIDTPEGTQFWDKVYKEIVNNSRR